MEGYYDMNCFSSSGLRCYILKGRHRTSRMYELCIGIRSMGVEITQCTFDSYTFPSSDWSPTVANPGLQLPRSRIRSDACKELARYTSFKSTASKTIESLSRTSSRGLYNRSGAEQMSQPLLCNLYCISHGHTLLASGQADRCGAIFQTELLVGPDWLRLDLDWHANTGSTTNSGPIGSSLQVELGEYSVDRFEEVFNLFIVVAWSRGNSEPLFASSDGREVDGLNVNVMLGEQHVGSFLGEGGVTDKDGDDVRWVGYDGNTELTESSLDFSSVDLLEPSIVHAFSLVGDCSLCTGYNGRWKGSGENESWGV